MPCHCGLCKFEAASAASKPMRCSPHLLDITSFLYVCWFWLSTVHHAVDSKVHKESNLQCSSHGLPVCLSFSILPIKMFLGHNSWKDTTIFLPLDWITWLPWRWENWLRLETILFPMGNRRAVGSDVVMFQFLHPAWSGLQARTQVFPHAAKCRALATVPTTNHTIWAIFS